MFYVSGMVGSHPHPVAESEFKPEEHPAVSPLFTANLIYFCEFLNIYNPFIEDLLGGFACCGR